MTKHRVRHRRANSLLIPAIALTLLALSAWADGVTDILPDGVTTTTIASPGSYRLAGDVTTADANLTVINIPGDNVTLDLNGHTLTGTAAAFTSGVGINVTGDDVTIHSGTVRSFPFNITPQSGASRVWLRDLRVLFATNGGILSGAPDGLVERCLISNQSGSPNAGLYLVSTAIGTTVRGCRITDIADNGVECIDGDEVQIIDNVISNITGDGLYLDVDTERATVIGNSFSNSGTGIDNDGTNNFIADNRAANNTNNYQGVSSVSSQAAANDVGDNLTP